METEGTQGPNRTLLSRMLPGTLLDLNENDAGENAKGIGRNCSEEGMSHTSIGSGFEKSTYAECHKTRLKFPLMPKHCETEDRQPIRYAGNLLPLV